MTRIALREVHHGPAHAFLLRRVAAEGVQQRLLDDAVLERERAKHARQRGVARRTGRQAERPCARAGRILQGPLSRDGRHCARPRLVMVEIERPVRRSARILARPLRCDVGGRAHSGGRGPHVDRAQERRGAEVIVTRRLLSDLRGGLVIPRLASMLDDPARGGLRIVLRVARRKPAEPSVTHVVRNAVHVSDRFVGIVAREPPGRMREAGRGRPLRVRE